MSTFSPASDDVKPDIFADIPTATTTTTSTSSGAPSAGPASGGVFWTNNGPMLRIANATVQTVYVALFGLLDND